MGPNGVKKDLNGSKGSKLIQLGPTRPKRVQMGPKGPDGSKCVPGR